MKKLFLLYYKNDKQVLFFAKDREMSVLQYIAVRYVETNETPVFMADDTGKCCEQEWNEEALEELVVRHYAQHPEHRRESQRLDFLAKFEAKLQTSLTA